MTTNKLIYRKKNFCKNNLSSKYFCKSNLSKKYHSKRILSKKEFSLIALIYYGNLLEEINRLIMPLVY